MKKYSTPDQKTLAACAADWGERVLPLFEDNFPDDDRPRQAIKACRRWVRTGIFHMAEICRASLDAHAAARSAGTGSPAGLAAHAAGQAVGTAHVPQHAFGAAYYALKAVAGANPEKADVQVRAERDWQAGRLRGRLRLEFLSRVLVDKTGGRIRIRIRRGADY